MAMEPFCQSQSAVPLAGGGGVQNSMVRGPKEPWSASVIRIFLKVRQACIG